MHKVCKVLFSLQKHIGFSMIIYCWKLELTVNGVSIFLFFYFYFCVWVSVYFDGESLWSLSSFILLLKKEKSQTFEYTKNFDNIKSLFSNSLIFVCTMCVTFLVLIVLDANLCEYLNIINVIPSMPKPYKR